MPANLSPEYHRAEDRLRAARTADEKIEALEEMLRVIPKHKGTDHMQADLKSRMAKVRKEAGKKSAKSGPTHMVPREGAGQVALVGPPNSGKSALVCALTRATPAVADYPFTTREATPGMMPFEDVAFQLVDLPPVSSQHVDAWVFDLIRSADLLWLVLDGQDPLEGFDDSRRLLDAKHITAYPAGRPPASPAMGQVHVPALLVLTAVDRPGVAASLDAVDDLLEHHWAILPVSTATGEGLPLLPPATFRALDIIRVYTKQPGKPADRRAPFALPRGATVADLTERIHRDLLHRMTFARVWGRSTFDGQAVQREHVLVEGDVVEIHE